MARLEIYRRKVTRWLAKLLDGQILDTWAQSYQTVSKVTRWLDLGYMGAKLLDSWMLDIFDQVRYPGEYGFMVLVVDGWCRRNPIQKTDLRKISPQVNSATGKSHPNVFPRYMRRAAETRLGVPASVSVSNSTICSHVAAVGQLTGGICGCEERV